MTTRTSMSALVIVLAAAAAAAPAAGQVRETAGVARAGDPVIIIGATPAQICFERARGGEASNEALSQCDYALLLDLNAADRAGTLVNRGIILEAQGDSDAALADYADALEINPDLAEAHINASRIHLAQQNWIAATASLDRAIPLVQDPMQLRALYFDRAVAREETGDVAGAYADYLAASAADPTWEAPKQELQRFQVESAASDGGA